MPINAANTLKTIEINVNSIATKKKQHELLEFIEENDPDILLVIETKLKPKNKLFLKNYNIFRNDRLTDNGGGTAIIIKNKIKCEQIEKINNIQNLEYTTAKIYMPNNKHLICTALYKQPSTKLQTRELTSLIQSFGNSLYILAGDFNCIHTHWGNQTDNNEGKQLFNWYNNSIDTHNLVLLATNEPTCIRRNSQSFIDLFITSDTLNIKFNNAHNKLETSDFPSDHRAVTLEIFIDKPQTNEKEKRKNWNNVNWTKFNAFIEKEISKYQLPAHENADASMIDLAVANLNNLFKVAIEKFVPEVETRSDTLIQLSA